MAKGRMHTPEQVRAFLAEVKSQSDRGTAIIAGSVMEELTELVILKRLIELSGERKDALFDKMGAPLSSFSAKIEMAYALGIIVNEFRLALHLIREIRNKFAHRIEALTFDHPEVAHLLDTRASEHFKESKTSRREKFLGTFSAAAVVLYGTLAADMRLKSLEETHPGHFLEWTVFAAQIALGETTTQGEA
jgi:hypothetical protein